MSDQPRPKRAALKLLKTLFLLALAFLAFADIAANGFGYFLSGVGTASVALLFWFLIKSVWARPDGDSPREPSVFLANTRAVLKSVLRGLAP